MSILWWVEKIHNNLNTYTTEDIKVFKFSANEWEAIINDDDYSLLQPIRDWRALWKTPIIEIPTGVLGVSSWSVAWFIYLPLIAVSQSSEHTVLWFQTMGGNLVCVASIACRWINVISFFVHTTNLPIISGNTVDGELLTTDWDELITSWISVSDLEDLHDDVNTKTFYLSGTSDLTNAQAAYDWYKAWKNPIIRISGWNYSFILEWNNSEPTYHLGFYWVNGGANDWISNSSIGINPRLELRYSSNTVTSVVVSWDNAHVLFTDVNYSTPYTPTYNGSPATKKYVDDSVSSAISAWTTAPSNPIEWMLWYDTTNDVLKVYDGTQRNAVDTDTTYNAWEWIKIWTYDDYSAMRWPCPEGFHVMRTQDFTWLKTIMESLSLTISDWSAKLKIPLSWDYGAWWSRYWLWERRGFKACDNANQYWAYIYWSKYPNWASTNRKSAHPIRPFKDKYETPTSSRTVIEWTLWSAWIFRDETNWLISITDWTNGYTITDKNLWATVVFNSGDSESANNVWNYYQWGNNYWFSYWRSESTSSSQVDASQYWPWNYYSDNTFRTWANPAYWDSSINTNLRWWETWVITRDNAITNTGVLSVNGQTGNVTIEAFQLAPNSPLTPKYRRYWSQAQYDALTQYYTDEAGDTVYFTI